MICNYNTVICSILLKPGFVFREKCMIPSVYADTPVMFIICSFCFQYQFSISRYNNHRKQRKEMTAMDNEFDYTPHYEDTPAPQNTPTPKKKSGSGKVIALALCFSLLGSALGAAGMYFALNGNTGIADSIKNEPSYIQQSDRETGDLETVIVGSGEEMSPAQVYSQNVNSTVGITTSVTTNFWGYQTTSAASGSGFVLSKDGYILTNYHVIEDSNSVTVSMYDGTTYDATIIGYDASNDIAVLKVEATDLTPVVLGNSDTLMVGDDVMAIGNPLGELTFSLTKGVVSAIDRRVTLSSGSTMNLIQTDCSINSGNSGGALFNIYGEVIGITNAKYSNNGDSTEASIESIGFAIPVNHILSIVESIVEKGYVAKPYIGLSVTDVSSEAQGYGLPKGAAVNSVTEGAPAAEAGLQKNDIIIAVNGNTIESADDLVSIVSDANPGDVLTLKIWRQNSTLELTVTVGENIQSTTPETEETTATWPSGGWGR